MSIIYFIIDSIYYLFFNYLIIPLIISLVIYLLLNMLYTTNCLTLFIKKYDK
jgi:hypothetical protein